MLIHLIIIMFISTLLGVDIKFITRLFLSKFLDTLEFIWISLLHKQKLFNIWIDFNIN